MDEQSGLHCLIISDWVQLIGSTYEILESRKRETDPYISYLCLFPAGLRVWQLSSTCWVVPFHLDVTRSFPGSSDTCPSLTSSRLGIVNSLLCCQSISTSPNLSGFLSSSYSCTNRLFFKETIPFLRTVLLSLLLFFCGAGDRILSLMHTRQALPLSYIPSPRTVFDSCCILSLFHSWVRIKD